MECNYRKTLNNMEKEFINSFFGEYVFSYRFFGIFAVLLFTYTMPATIANFPLTLIILGTVGALLLVYIIMFFIEKYIWKI